MKSLMINPFGLGASSTERKLRRFSAEIIFGICLLFFSIAKGDMMQVDFLNIGKADAILIRTLNAAVMIDAGKEKDAECILQFMRNEQISHLDLLIVTHYDKDHVGGADHIINEVRTDRVLLPNYESESKQYRQFFQAMEEKKLTPEYLTSNISFKLDDMQISIDVANEEDYGEEEENDFSLITEIQYGEIRFYFAGDAENPRLKELLQEGIHPSQVLKVPHHGRIEKKTEEFLEAVHPEISIITSSDEEQEEAAVLKILENIGSKVFLTRQGTVTCVTDGKAVSVRQETH